MAFCGASAIRAIITFDPPPPRPRVWMGWRWKGLNFCGYKLTMDIRLGLKEISKRHLRKRLATNPHGRNYLSRSFYVWLRIKPCSEGLNAFSFCAARALHIHFCWIWRLWFCTGESNSSFRQTPTYRTVLLVTAKRNVLTSALRTKYRLIFCRVVNVFPTGPRHDLACFLSKKWPLMMNYDYWRPTTATLTHWQPHLVLSKRARNSLFYLDLSTLFSDLT